MKTKIDRCAKHGTQLLCSTDREYFEVETEGNNALNILEFSLEETIKL